MYNLGRKMYLIKYKIILTIFSLLTPKILNNSNGKEKIIRVDILANIESVKKLEILKTKYIQIKLTIIVE